MSVNPYESPEADLDFALAGGVKQLEPPVRVDGVEIVVPTWTILPARCVKTNEPVPEEQMINKKFVWSPRWIWALFLVNPLIWFAVDLVARKKCDLTFALHRDLRRLYRRRIVYKLLVIIAIYLSIASAAWTKATDWQTAMIVGAVIFGPSLLVLLIGNSPLMVTAHKAGKFWIRGCSEEFRDSFAEEIELWCQSHGYS
jgi:hypothetical protein